MITPFTDSAVFPQRRLIVSDGATTGVAQSFRSIPPLPEFEAVKPPQEIDDRSGETRRVVKRLLAIIEDHRVSAQRMGVPLDAAALECILHALEVETKNGDPAAVLSAGDDVVRNYVLTALYDDLLAEPSNILFTTQVAEDVVRYEAMDGVFWQECVAATRQVLSPA